MYANDLGIFIGNGGYHLEEGAKVKILGPRTVVNTGQKTVFELREVTTNFPHVVVVPL